MSTPSDEGYARIVLRGSITLKTAVGQDKDGLRQLTAGGTVVIVLRNAQGKVLGQMPQPPEKPDFSTGEIDDPVIFCLPAIS